jgi:hypothetical protein
MIDWRHLSFEELHPTRKHCFTQIERDIADLALAKR